MLRASLLTVIATCKHLERKINIPAGVFATILCILCIHSFLGTRPERRNASTCRFLTFSSVPAGHVKSGKYEGGKKVFHFHWWDIYRIYVYFLYPTISSILWIIPDQLASKMKYSSLFSTCLCISGMYIWNAVLICTWTLVRVHGKENVIVSYIYIQWMCFDLYCVNTVCQGPIGYSVSLQQGTFSVDLVKQLQKEASQ